MDNKTQATVFARSATDNMRMSIRKMFDAAGVAPQIKSVGEILVKINGIDFKPFTFTDPAVVDAALGALRDLGAKKIRLMENCTQGNFTRLVFRHAGYLPVCRRHGVRPLYLDEGHRETLKLRSFDYEVGIHRRLARMLRERESTFYLNIPKLKTHSMSVVTIGIKNQFGLIDQKDRIRDHNFKLHRKLVDILRHFRPDFTLVDALYAVYNGHYPAAAHLDQCVDRLDLLLGGTDVLAVDTIGSHVLGYAVDDVEHLRLARKAGLGCGVFGNIHTDGLLPDTNTQYNFDILMDFPPDIEIIRGTELCCKEGCRKNTETLIQTLYRDYGGRGGFTVLMGKGFDPERIKHIEGPVHIAGTCAAEETLSRIKINCTHRRITVSYGCNDLASSIDGLTKQMGVKVIGMTPNALTSIIDLIAAKLHGSRARVPKIVSVHR